MVLQSFVKTVALAVLKGKTPGTRGYHRREFILMNKKI